MKIQVCNAIKKTSSVLWDASNGHNSRVLSKGGRRRRNEENDFVRDGKVIETPSRNAWMARIV
jgi:hypothetical protein